MYYLSVSYYVNMSWGQRTLLKAVSPLINPETLAKMKFTGDGVHPEIRDMFHPGQLERRFGGEMDTPTNFWPPYVGKEFIPPKQEAPMTLMNDDQYRQALRENPDLNWHPEFINSPECPSRDFKYAADYSPTGAGYTDKDRSESSHQSFYSVPSHAPGSMLSRGMLGASAQGSVYLDAYNGDPEHDEALRNANYDLKPNKVAKSA